MAIESGSISKQKPGVSGKKERAEKPQKKDKGSAISSLHAKRNKSPGVRVVGGRIYDSKNGRTCHQCRQKTLDFTAACKNQNNNKPCPIMFCHKCLLNRYGENAEEVATFGEWSCPKCRGICNCSFCMKKKGCQPTGILINAAKRTGFSSVSEMLLNGGEQCNYNRERVVAEKITSPKKDLSPKKQGKENCFDGKVDANLPTPVFDQKSDKVEKGAKKRKAKQEGLLDMHGANSNVVVSKKKKMKLNRPNELNNGRNDKEISKETSLHDSDKINISRSDGLENANSKKKDAALARRTSPRKLISSNKKSNQEAEPNTVVDTETKLNPKINVTKRNPISIENEKKNEVDSDIPTKGDTKQQTADFHAYTLLPLGMELTSVAGTDLCVEDVGNALQFLEFCAVFGKILDVKKGQPEYVIRDLLLRRTGRRAKVSATVQFHIHLISVLQEDQGEECETLSPPYGKNSWFNALKECLSESQNILKAQGLDSLDTIVDYETLNSSEKLRLLNVLCDEVLLTAKVRSWIDDQQTAFAVSVKEVKQKLLVAKNKEKSLKQKIKDDIATAIIANQGAPLSISEIEAIGACIKSETKKAHAKVLESNGLFLEKNQIPDVVRIEPIITWCGRSYWKLNAFDKSDVLCQNIGKGDTLTFNEKWSIIDGEGKETIEKLICSLRGKM